MILSVPQIPIHGSTRLITFNTKFDLLRFNSLPSKAFLLALESGTDRLIDSSIR